MPLPLAALLAAAQLAAAPPAPAPVELRCGDGPLPAGARRVACPADRPFTLDVPLPEGTYDVTVTLGRDDGPGRTTVRAEARRLMLERVATAAGDSVTRTFTVSVRTPRLADGDSVRLNAREVGSATWDDRLTLEFTGERPALRAVRVAPVARRPVTVHLAGNSTVVDQPAEPYAAWGQMIPRFFRPGAVVVANHAESGETLRAFVAQRRLDKLLENLQAGDYLFVEFAHNDQKPGPAHLEPFTTYRAELLRWIGEARARGATPVLVTSTQRRRFGADGRVENTLGDYPAAVRRVAAEARVPLVDLTAATTRLYEALGPERSKLALVHHPAHSFPGQAEPLADDTHFSGYGAYQIARMVADGIRAAGLPLAEHLVDDVPPLDPARPDAPEDFALPPSPVASPERPLGDRDTTAAHYLFAYFEGDGDGLHLAHSTDGLRWRALRGGRALFTPTVGTEKLLRDPSIARGPDGRWHMVWTTGWRERGFGYAWSTDLVHWQGERFVPVMAHEPTTANTWAPEIFHDSAGGQFLIFWASTIPGRFPQTDAAGVERYNHRMYVTTTRDFATFTPARLFYEPGHSVIDAFLVRDGDRHVMFLKNETDRPVAEKNIRLAFADRAEGPYSAPSAPITGDYWAEGPTVLRVGGRWHLYFDRYRERRYGLLVSDDLRAWRDETARLEVPDGIRHGTTFEVPADVAERLLRAERP